MGKFRGGGSVGGGGDCSGGGGGGGSSSSGGGGGGCSGSDSDKIPLTTFQKNSPPVTPFLFLPTLQPTSHSRIKTFFAFATNASFPLHSRRIYTSYASLTIWWRSRIALEHFNESKDTTPEEMQ
ncbi:hypothetical protein Pmani_036604 [Petrolisthes manimaculis]|uniref:Uncharacterized protein n=1 Tax=Petrolisthes manimaculis TaxID=1843537 RepID=A0AAE1NJE7_9EUCA|nr:hypothetical protein Pmani_036604 [Petrolisthes manimaculis]